MSWLSFEDLDRRAVEYDNWVARTPAIDRFCSSTLWVSPARAAFAPDAEPYIHADSSGIIAMMIIRSAEGARVATPLEAAWGLAAPFGGLDPNHVAAHLEWMIDHSSRPPEALFISGIRPGGAWMNTFARQLRDRFRLGLGPDCLRRASSIANGFEGYLATRSAKFRAELRRAIRKAAAAGVRYEGHQPTSATEARRLLERAMAIEAESWKGLAEEGVNEGAPLEFYRLMVEGLAARGALRFVFATSQDEDLAFVFGGVFGDTFRGLQMSYRAEFKALSPGNLMQAEMIRRLCLEGIPIYDLGTDMPYKTRWADASLETATLALLPR